MHDPMTLAFSLKWPWFWRKYRPPLLDVWHVDPETDGSDDSCGWSFPRLTKKQRSILEHLAYCESRTPWYQRDPVKRIGSAADAESLMRGAIAAVSYCLKIKLTWDDTCKLACDLTHNLHDNFQGSLCHLPGWHTNFKHDDADERKQRAMGFFCSVARVLLRRSRPWYRHPRWHFWHWKLRLYPTQHLKRWAFTRCQYCGKGFRWGESVCSNSWNGTGPLWFRSERHVHHSGCSKRSTAPVQGDK